MFTDKTVVNNARNTTSPSAVPPAERGADPCRRCWGGIRSCGACPSSGVSTLRRRPAPPRVGQPLEPLEWG